MKNSAAPLQYLLLYIPWLISLFLASDPVASYLAAWLGSFFIFYLSFSNKVRKTSPHEPLSEKILRPLFLLQVIFAGYLCCTSVFYFLDQLGYVYATKQPHVFINYEELIYTASCQRDYVLGHAALAHGLLLFYPADIKEKYAPVVNNWPGLFIRIAIICIPVGIFFQNVNGLAQFAIAAEGLSFVAATLAFAIAIPQRKFSVILLSGALYGFGLVQALNSGFKEPVIVSVIMMGILLYPFYKKTVIVLFVPLLLVLFMVLPTYVNTFRQQSWGKNNNGDAARAQALLKVKEEMSGDNLKKTNWLFLTTRISEIEMFVKYKKGVEKHGFYGFQIVEQSLLSIIPRFLWPSKPVTEKLAMERAFDNNIVDRIANVSAKPAFLVDGYLSGGKTGIWLALFLYGAIAQLVANKAEQLFGGYLLGTVLVFTALFRPMWRGDCFEFVFNYVFWSYVSMYIIFYIFKKARILKRVINDEAEPAAYAGKETYLTEVHG